LLRREKDLNWTFLSSSALFVERERTAKFRLGTDQILTAADGKSWITFADFAVAIADEIERPAHLRGRFTVGYQPPGAPSQADKACLINMPVQGLGGSAGERREILSVTRRRYIRPRSMDPSVRLAAEEDGLALEKLKNYRPTEKEPFMNDRQKEYFRQKLLAWKDEILKESKLTLQALQEENVNHPDLADRASSETDRAIELRARDRQRKLIAKIDAALQRIEDNTYGYCEETGEPISLKRLEARPIATLSVEAQERHEKREKVYRDE
jgi:DnaK suppressor protein